jgi:hypothetical protein
MTLSGSIDAQAERFSMQELTVAAEDLLRQHSNAALNDSIEPSRVQFYIERQWVDEPIRDEEGEHFRKRHLLQLCAVQVMRGLDLGLDDIGKLVRGVDNEYLRMLCDDPAEAEKKAAVMSNWLGMLDKGRRSPARKGRTVNMKGASVERAFAPPPPPPPPLPASVERSGTPDDLPDAIDGARKQLAPRNHGRPQTLPATGRDRRILLAAGEEALLAALDSRTPLQPGGFATIPPAPEAPTPAPDPDVTPMAPERAVSPPASRSTIGVGEDDRDQKTAPITPIKVPQATAAEEESGDEAASDWTRHRVVDGIELHVRSGRRMQAKGEFEAALRRVVEILEADV